MKPCIWVIACQPETSASLRRELALLQSQGVTTCGAAPGLPSHGQPPLPLARIHAAVLVVDRSAFASEAFVAAARLAIGAMSDRDDFCVFPLLLGVTVAELRVLAAQQNDLAATLLENIHLDTSMESLAGVVRIIEKYLAQIETLKAFSRFERLSCTIAQIAGKGAVGLSCAAVLAALVVSLLLQKIVTGGATALEPFGRAAAILTWTAVSILALHQYHLLRLFADYPHVQVDYPRIRSDVLSTSAIGGLLTLEGLALHQTLEPVLIGLGIGIALMSTVRAGRRAQNLNSRLAEIPGAIADGTMLPQLYEEMTGTILSTGIPLFEPFHKRIFISYSSASPWSSTVAVHVAELLRTSGAKVFLDQPSLRSGFSWKKQLRWAIDNANVFIAVLDQVAVRREWVAAEFATALRNKALKRTPEIFVVHPKDMDFSATSNPASAFFADVLVRPSHPIPEWMRSKLAAYDTSTCTAMCKAIRTFPLTAEFGVPANLAIGLAVNLLVIVAGFASNLALPLLGVVLLSTGGIAELTTLVCARTGAMLPASAVLALLGGYSVRSAVRCFAEIRRSAYAYTPGYLELVEALVFFGGAWVCFPSLSLTDWCVLGLMIFFGIELGNVFAVCMRSWKVESV